MSRQKDQTDAQRAVFDRMIGEYESPIFNYALRMVGDADRAADIAQDTFIKAYRKLDTLTDAAATRSWLYRIATNTALDELRRRRHTTPMPDEQQDLVADERPGPEAQVMSAQLDERIGRALLHLRPNHRQCLLLSDLEEMSAGQIGEVMEMKPGAVRVLLCRARAEMRRLLAVEGLVR